MGSTFDRRLASGLAVAVLVLLVAAAVALVAGRDPASASPAPARPAAAAGAHEPVHVGPADMAAVQHAVSSAYCPPPGSEIAPGDPTSTVEIEVDGDAYGDGPLTIPAGELVRVRLVNADDRAHRLGVFHASRPGCPLILATAAAGETVEADLRLAAGTYVYGDPTHEGERDLLKVEGE